MRIISGKYKGRKIIPPKGLPVRPTTDFAKEALFNVLSNYFNFEETTVLDLFAGTGNISYEFASREIKSITSIDANYNCVKFIKKNMETLSVINSNVFKADVFKWLQKANGQYNLIFADPPYDHPNIAKIPELIFSQNLLAKNGWLITEHGKQTTFTENVYFSETRKYSNVHFSIFKNE